MLQRGCSSLESGISLLLKPCLAKEPLSWILPFYLLGGIQRSFYSSQAWHPLQEVFVHPYALIFIHGNAKLIISPMEFSFV